MTRKDWLCFKCNNEMVRISDKYITCLCGNTRLFNVWSMGDLPEATQINSRDFWVKIGVGKYQFRYGIYQYVPHGHKTALDKAPPEGCVVASVAFRGGRAVRLFRRKRTLIERLREHHFQELGEAAEK